MLTDSAASAVYAPATQTAGSASRVVCLSLSCCLCLSCCLACCLWVPLTVIVGAHAHSVATPIVDSKQQCHKTKPNDAGLTNVPLTASDWRAKWIQLGIKRLGRDLLAIARGSGPIVEMFASDLNHWWTHWWRGCVLWLCFSLSLGRRRYFCWFLLVCRQRRYVDCCRLLHHLFVHRCLLIWCLIL